MLYRRRNGGFEPRHFIAHEPTSTGVILTSFQLSDILGYRSGRNWQYQPMQCNNKQAKPAHSPNIGNKSRARCFIAGILRASASQQIFFVMNSAYLDCDMQDEYGHRYQSRVL